MPYHPPGPERVRLGDDERAELEFLRAENELLRTERDVLVRVATGFAEDTNAILVRRATHRPDPALDHEGSA